MISRLTDTVQLCAFKVGGEDYVLDILRVEEIIAPLPLTPVPHAPAAIEGVVNLRGQIIPVVVARKRLLNSEHDQGSSKKARLMICKIGPRRVGLLVDAVLAIFRVPASALKPAPLAAVKGSLAPVLGVCDRAGALYLMLDVKALVSPPETEVRA